MRQANHPSSISYLRDCIVEAISKLRSSRLTNDERHKNELLLTISKKALKEALTI